MSRIINKKYIHPICLIFISVAIALTLIEIALYFFPVRTHPKVLGFDKEYSVSHFKPNTTGTWSKGWNFAMVNTVHSNNYGFINDYDYFKDSKKPLIAVIGDSYVQSLYIPFSKTVQNILSEYLEQMRVYSFGISGAALPRYLIYAEYVKKNFKASAAIFTIYRNDYAESFYKYKGHPEYYFFEKENSNDYDLRRIDLKIPWYEKVLNNSRLFQYLKNNVELFHTIKEIPTYDDRYIYNIDVIAPKELIDDSKNAVNKFLQDLPLMSGLKPSSILFVVDGIREFIYSPAMYPNMRNSYVYIMNNYFINQARLLGYHVIDLNDVFSRHFLSYSQKFEYIYDSHWNELAHRLIAEEIVKSNFLENFKNEN